MVLAQTKGIEVEVKTDISLTPKIYDLVAGD